MILDCQFCDLATEGPDIIMHQLKSIYNTPFKDSHSHPIYTCFPMIASKVLTLEGKNHREMNMRLLETASQI